MQMVSSAGRDRRERSRLSCFTRQAASTSRAGDGFGRPRHETRSQGAEESFRGHKSLPTRIDGEAEAFERMRAEQRASFGDDREGRRLPPIDTHARLDDGEPKPPAIRHLEGVLTVRGKAQAPGERGRNSAIGCPRIDEHCDGLAPRRPFEFHIHRKKPHAPIPLLMRRIVTYYAITIAQNARRSPPARHRSSINRLDLAEVALPDQIVLPKAFGLVGVDDPPGLEDVPAARDA